MCMSKFILAPMTCILHPIHLLLEFHWAFLKFFFLKNHYQRKAEDRRRYWRVENEEVQIHQKCFFGGEWWSNKWPSNNIHSFILLLNHSSYNVTRQGIVQDELFQIMYFSLIILCIYLPILRYFCGSDRSVHPRKKLPKLCL